MFVHVMHFTLLYAALESILHTVVANNADYWVYVLLQQSLEAFITLGIGYTIRAQPLNAMSQQEEPVTWAARSRVVHVACVYLYSGVWVCVPCSLTCTCVRARELQVRQIAAELSTQMMPRILTVTVQRDVLSGPNMIAWRDDSILPGAPQLMLPATLVVLNPGDTEELPALGRLR